MIERVVELTAAGGLLTVRPLVASTPAGQQYQNAAAYIAERQRHQHGRMYWFFSAPVVAATNLTLEHIRDTRTLWEIASIVEGVCETILVKLCCSTPVAPRFRR